MEAERPAPRQTTRKTRGFLRLRRRASKARLPPDAKRNELTLGKVRAKPTLGELVRRALDHAAQLARPVRFADWRLLVAALLANVNDSHGCYSYHARR